MNDGKKGPGDYRDDPYYALARYMGLGFEIAIAIVLCIYGGYKLDQRFNTSPLFLVVGLVLGFAVVINILIMYSRAANRDADRDKKE